MCCLLRDLNKILKFRASEVRAQTQTKGKEQKRENMTENQRARRDPPKERQISRKLRMGWLMQMSRICVNKMMTPSNWMLLFYVLVSCGERYIFPSTEPIKIHSMSGRWMYFLYSLQSNFLWFQIIFYYYQLCCCSHYQYDRFKWWVTEAEQGVKD